MQAEKNLNRIQSVIIGVLSSVAAFGSLSIGSGMGGVWFVLFAVLYPALLVGSYLLFLFRAKGSTVEGKIDLRSDTPYLVAMAVLVAMLLISLLVFGS
jgi:hypothetical protein